MNQATEQTIITVTGTATKVAGTATAASGTVGWLAFMLDHQQIFLLFFAFIGVVITMFTAAINARYQRKKDEREIKEHERNLAVMDYQLEQMEAEKERKRRQED
ncbi:MAG: hypothetical protein GY861_03995 [bacterium]|nr:hypothetical protein [bacterium]